MILMWWGIVKVTGWAAMDIWSLAWVVLLCIRMGLVGGGHEGHISACKIASEGGSGLDDRGIGTRPCRHQLTRFIQIFEL